MSICALIASLYIALAVEQKYIVRILFILIVLHSAPLAVSYVKTAENCLNKELFVVFGTAKVAGMKPIFARLAIIKKLNDAKVVGNPS